MDMLEVRIFFMLGRGESVIIGVWRGGRKK